MTAYNATSLPVSGLTAAAKDGYVVHTDPVQGLMWRRLDFKKFIAKNGVTLAQNDLIGVLPQKKGMVITAVHLIIKKLDTAAGAVTLAIGDADNATGWYASASLKDLSLDTVYGPEVAAIGSFLGVNSTGAAAIGSAGKVVTADGVINLKILGATTAIPTNAQVIVVAKYYMLNAITNVF